MAEHIGKMIECDRCGKTHFLYYTGTESYDCGYTKVDLFDDMPDGWKKYYDTGLLCDECAKAYQDMLDEFFDR